MEHRTINSEAMGFIKANPRHGPTCGFDKPDQRTECSCGVHEWQNKALKEITELLLRPVRILPALALGQSVTIAAANIKGEIVEYSVYLDGSERFHVQYWHNGERKTVSCMELDLKVEL